MKKPLIGVCPLWDQKRSSLWMLPGYMNAIVQTGGIPVMLPLTTDPFIIADLVDSFDGFLFTGGQDISPTLYGEKKLESCGEPCAPRDRLEQLLFQQAAIMHNKPVLGICRGIQMINVLLEGTLYQDLPIQYLNTINHQQKPPYNLPRHLVTVLQDTPLHQLLGKTELRVNSYHHQAIKSLADQLKPMAQSEDGLVEAVYMPSRKYVYAVQWHPEYLEKDPDSFKLFESFVLACNAYT